MQFVANISVFDIVLNVRDEYYDEVFADKDIVKKANELGAVLDVVL